METQYNRPHWKERRVGALWQRKTAKNDDKYIIKINIDGEDFNLIAFPNTVKKEPQHPDFIVYRATEDMQPTNRMNGNRHE